MIKLTYTQLLIAVDIGTECMDVFSLTTLHRRSSSLQWMLLSMGSQSVVSRSSGCAQRWEALWCVQQWMVRLDGICHSDRVASISGLIRATHLACLGLEGSPEIVNFAANCVFGCTDGIFRRDLYRCQDFFTHDGWQVHYYSHRWELNIGGSSTLACTEYGEIPSIVDAPSKSMMSRVLAVEYVLKTYIRILLCVNVQQSLGCCSTFITAVALKSLVRGLCSIPTFEYFPKAPLLIMIWLMLLESRIIAFRLMFPHCCWFMHRLSNCKLVYK